MKEVEKLQAAQQLTSTLLPPSLVSTMPSDDDKCLMPRDWPHGMLLPSHQML